MLKRIFSLTLIAFLPAILFAQKWNLRTIADYAMANNINVKLSDVQARVAAINYNQSKLSQYPTASFNANTGVNSGSNQDPNSFSRTTNTFLSSGFQLQSNTDIFNFYRKKNTIASNEWEMKAAQAATDKIKNDIVLTAANAYLQVLLSREQENIASVQIQQTRAQLLNIRKQVDAGALPELNATQLEGQLASDSVNYITAKGNTNIALLTLKSYMNIDAAAPFEYETPPVELIPVEPIASLQPDYVYSLALQNMPQQRYNEFKLKAAERTAEATRGAMYPSLGLYLNLNSSFNNKSRLLTGFRPGLDSSGKTFVNNTPYTVYTPTASPVFQNYSFTNQVADNFGQGVGITLNVPIFSGGSLRSNYQRSKLNITSVQLQKERDDNQLKQDIYRAYNDALIAFEKFNASKKAVDINELTNSYANKRFEAGMLGTFDLITTQNNLLRARLEYALNRYDYVFKMKVLEFYKGMGLKL